MERTTFESPLGLLLLEANEKALQRLLFLETGKKASETSNHPALKKAIRQLKEYFKGDRKLFNLPLQPEGTSFQQSVWRALQSIPYGQTQSYSQIAKSIKKPDAKQAVGTANGKNPLPIIIPCHRVIGSDGTLVGYSGGIDKKRWLLEHENALLL